MRIRVTSLCEFIIKLNRGLACFQISHHMRAAIAVSAPPATSPNASLVTAANVCTVYAPVAVERLYFQAVKVVVFVESNRGSVVEA